MRQLLGKAAKRGVGASVASADVEGAFDCIKHDDIERALLQKGVHPESVCSLLRESSDLKGTINLPGVPMSPAFLYARGARQGSVEGPDMWKSGTGQRTPRTCRSLGNGGNRLHACQRLPQSPKEASRFIW